MKNLKEENAKLKNDIQNLKLKINEADREIQIQQNNIEKYDLDKQMIMQKIRKLLFEKDEQKLEKRIKEIIERLPCQIEQKSLKSLTKSIIQKGIGVLNDLNFAYKNAYDQDYRNCTVGKCQPLVESFFIIGVKHKQFRELQQQNHIVILKPKILYKQCKSEMNADERKIWIGRCKEIKKYFQNNLIVAEKLYDLLDIKTLISQCLKEKDVLLENSFMFNLKGSSFDKQVPKNIELLTSFNQNKQLFVFVQAVDDYIASFQDDGFQYWKFKKYYCFMTYFPIPEIFDQLLMFTTNIIQEYRSDANRKHQEYIKGRTLWGKITQSEEAYYNQKILQDIDAVNINYMADKDKDKELKNFINLLLEQYLDFDKPQLKIIGKSMLQQNFEISYSLPIQQINLGNPEGLMEARNQIIVNSRVKYAHIILQIFTFDDFMTIFEEILKEGQIVFFCQNINILTSVCYFFHQVIYPYIWFDPAIYYSNPETLKLLENDVSFILGINTRFNDSSKNEKIFKSSKLMMVELKIVKKRDGHNISAFIHQSHPSNTRLNLKPLPYYEINKSINNYKSPNSNFQTSITQDQAETCKQFLQKIIQLIQTEFTQNIVPKYDQYFTNNGWNKNLIKEAMKMIVKKDQEFVINYIFESKYFQEYLKQKYNFKDNN